MPKVLIFNLLESFRALGMQHFLIPKYKCMVVITKHTISLKKKKHINTTTFSHEIYFVSL